MSDESLPALPITAASAPTRLRTVRRQVEMMDAIVQFLATLPEYDRQRWWAALQPLADSIVADLSVQEGTGTLGALLAAGYAAPGDEWVRARERPEVDYE